RGASSRIVDGCLMTTRSPRPPVRRRPGPAFHRRTLLSPAPWRSMHRWLRRLLPAGLILSLSCGDLSGGGGPTPAPLAGDDGWATASPDSAGLDSRRLEQLGTRIQSGQYG